MVRISENANLRFELKNREIAPPLEWPDIAVIATFENGDTQATIETDRFSFPQSSRLKNVADPYDIIVEHYERGLQGGVGIFEGIQFKITAYNLTQSRVVFDGFIDLTNEFILDRENRIAFCNIVKKEGINSVEKRLNGITFGFLESEGFITAANYQDLDYVVEDVISVFQIINTNIIFFLLITELERQVRELARDIANPVGETSGGITGVIGAAILAAASITFQAIYTAGLLKAVLDLGDQLFRSFLSPLRTHKLSSFRTLLSAICRFLNLELRSDIALLDRLFYLASNNRVDSSDKAGFIQDVGSVEKGIPNSNDFGYNAIDMLNFMQDLFLARYTVSEGIFYFYPKISNFWERDSTYIQPSVKQQPEGFNTAELIANYLILFSTDINDLFTRQNYRGTSYAINTRPISVDIPEAVFVSGAQTFDFPFALANRKDELTALENLLVDVGNTLDDIASVFGGRSNFAKRIKNRVGSMKVSQNNHTVPKIVYLEGGRIPQNHRDLFSAKVIWEQFHIYNSFIDNNQRKQRSNFSSVEVKFSFSNFIELVENSYFRDFNNERGKMTRLEWLMGGDKATQNYYLEKPYTNNLRQTFIEEE